MPQSLFNDGFIALQNLFKQDGLAIQKSDNGNSVGIVDRQNYIEKMERKGIKNRQKVTIVNMKDDTLLNFTVNQEKHAEKVLKKLVESNNVTEKNRKLLKPVGSARSFMYGVYVRYIKQAWGTGRHYFDQVCWFLTLLPTNLRNS